MNINKDKKILVAMSGGVDSSTVCMLLLEQGYQIEGVTMRMWDTPKSFVKFKNEQPDYILEARNLAQRLNFPHHVLDVRPEFKEKVIDYFVHSYMAGRTPNPCVECNKYIKWTFLLNLADRLGCQYIATGHYARIEQKAESFYIKKGVDDKKDQSYFLWGVPSIILERTILPLGNMTKEETRQEAIRNGFESLASKSESMEICFVENDYRDFLKMYYPEIEKNPGQGFYVDVEGKKLGLHNGYPFYTIGQRKGLRIALGYPAYVLKINTKKNTVMLGEKSLLDADEIFVVDYCIINRADFEREEPIEVKIRYKSKGIEAQVEILDEFCMWVKFKSPVNAVTPGQTAAFYQENCLLGGGIIADMKDAKRYRKILRDRESFRY